MPAALQLTGQKFGSLTVIEKLGMNKSGNAVWLCSCECGGQREVVGAHLRNGTVVACMNRQVHQVKKKAWEYAMWKGHGEISGAYWHSIVSRSERKGQEVTVTIAEVWDLFLAQDRKCALSGLPLVFSPKRYGSDGTASLDRIDSSKGYVRGNLQWLHKDVNRIKSDLQQGDFVRLCKLVADNSKGIEL